MPWACITPDPNTTVNVRVASNASLTNISTPVHSHDYGKLIRYNFYAIVIPVLMVIGVVGNTMNLITLTRRRLRRRMEVMERSATTGLAFLFLYELLLCSVLLPYPYFYFRGTSHARPIVRILSVYYNSYYAIILNIFLFTCTWVTVVISVERYIAVCHVFKARYLIKIRRTVATHLLVFVFCIGFSLIELVSKQVIWRQFPSCHMGLFIRENYDLMESLSYKAYLISRSVLGVLVPFIVLAYCNIRIVVTIARRNTSHLQEGTNRPRPQARTTTIKIGRAHV